MRILTAFYITTDVLVILLALAIFAATMAAGVNFDVVR